MLLTTAATALACPLCKDSVPSSDAQAAGGLPSGFNNSIYLMLGAFFCVLGFLTFTIVKTVARDAPDQRQISHSRCHQRQLERREVLQDLQPTVLALLRVELRRHHVVAPDAADEGAAVVGGRGDDVGVVFGDDVVAVDEVDARLRRAGR